MSASKEQKLEKELERKRQQEEQAKAERRSMRLYTVVGVVCALAVAAVLVLNSGLLQRSMAAVTVNGTDYSAADMQYYYNMEYQNAAQNSQTYAMYGLDYGFDYTKAPADQVYDTETGETWEEHLWDNAKQSAVYLTAMVDAAQKAGHTMSADAQETLASVLASVESVWVGTYTSRDAFLRANYGSYMTYDRFVELLEREVLASDYASTVAAAMEYTDAERETYYTEHADELDTFTYRQYVLRANAPTAAEGEEELTEEEIEAGLEQAKAEQKAVAEEIKAKLEGGADPQALAEEYKDALNTTSIDLERLGSSVGASTYAEWMLAPERKTGDVTISEYDSGSSYIYYVIQYGERFRVQDPTADVRHMLIAAEVSEGATEPTQEQYDAAKEKAQFILDTWKQGEATEESFAALVAENTADTSSAASGGLMEAVSLSSGFIPEFTDWALDPSRQEGDTGLVQNTGSSVKGWHVMYYVGDNLPIWAQTAESALRNEDFTAWEETVTEGYEAVDGSGKLFQ